MTVQETFNLALEHHLAGRLGEAEALYRQILAGQPNHHESLHLLGMLACQAGKHSDAQDLVQLAIVINPAAEYYASLGVILGFLGRRKDAAAAFRSAVKLKPNYPEGHNNLGNALASLKEWEPAVEAFRTALAQRPDFVDAHFNLGAALLGAEDFDGAIVALRRAIELNPNFAEAHGSLGNAFSAKGEYSAAIDSYRKAAELQPESAMAHSNLAAALSAAGEFDAALAEARRSLEITPDYADAHVTVGVIQLLRGELAEGWKHYESRWEGARHLPKRIWSSQPVWDGTGGEGKRLLLHSEQGFGDTIQFARYAKLAAQRGCKVYLVVPPQVLPVVRGIEGVHTAVAVEQPPPPFNAQCSLLSMPFISGTTLADIPADVPYIKADIATAERWRARFDPIDRRKKIGIAWAGRKTHSNDRKRSVPLGKFSLLGGVPDLHWVNLQKEDGAEQLAGAPMPISDWTRDLKDFGDTAGLVANLDLVICADTAVAHLAGAMGKPVWVLLPLVPDWRWMLGREDSPWYPAMRLFRQETAGDWDGVMRRVLDALGSL